MYFTLCESPFTKKQEQGNPDLTVFIKKNDRQKHSIEGVLVRRCSENAFNHSTCN